MNTTEKHSTGHFGRITSVKDLPPDKILLKMIKEACALNDKKIKLTRPAAIPVRIVIPEDLTKAQSKNKKAAKTFSLASSSYQKEYIT